MLIPELWGRAREKAAVGEAKGSSSGCEESVVSVWSAQSRAGKANSDALGKSCQQELCGPSWRRKRGKRSHCQGPCERRKGQGGTEEREGEEGKGERENWQAEKVVCECIYVCVYNCV